MTESYDPDEIPGSPGLKATQVDYSLKDSPPPFGEPPPEGDVAKPPVDDVAPFSGSSRKRLPESPKPRTLEGNSVLIRHLEPNRPDIANFEYQHGFTHEPVTDDSFEKPTKLRSKLDNALLPEPCKPTETDSLKAAATAKQALDLVSLDIKEDPRENAQFGLTPKEPIHSPEQSSPKQEQQHTPPNNISSLLSDPPPRQERKLSDPDSRLSKLLLVNPSTSPGQVLPALHSSSTGNSVDHSLPSLQTALAAVTDVPPNPAVRINGSSSYTLPPVQASSPVSRTDSLWDHQRMGQFGPTPQVPPSPYSHLSPASSKEMSTMPSPASQSPYWRIKEIPYLTSPYEVASSTVKSPATGYPTPTDQTPTGSCDRLFNPSAQVNGPVPAGTYKCRYPGCTAPPFQTQYLLNSHANVHSQDRPHFCPIEGCPRGPGGKGFKRKNEMIRHGLVHNSPGYVCPFCPDQQHKYPRPDNLQRHVRVHHVDKNKDDPALRQVLAQRPEGSNRGRRRRTNAQ
ncbi:hypothetical protein BO86DRAFT_428207 [Aspergillus japonicus CBS 114.51]|uniref:C2H2-type domain-containing protein n=2 Tax=Aspergillus TaxID=5052 RepID=A0A2V5H6Q0_ASPV1|nr:hypothetical protein BO86DRAFT_428207 [Aspergillus japonicus CBS 114.51]PYI19211.1 hypothetical protein BO99DRAFT_143212 [Aspergillus violaceofuscus CBS 115571]RAH82489.1 hypothetical protein BO86DRAFT_428207 [Aspergillus japonicus CBS 114.51]